MQLFLLIWLLHLPVITVSSPFSEPPPPLYPQVIRAEYGLSYPKTINTSIEWVFLYSNANHTEGARIHVESDATQDEPLIVVVKQKKGILSWQIPLLVQRTESESVSYSATSRTLCSSDYYKNEWRESIGEEEEFIIVSISTGSEAQIHFNLSVVSETDFNIRSGESRKVVVSPAEPRYYSYNFSDQVESGSVLVKIESDEDTCMTVSIQNPSCPVSDLERNIQFSGYWQTVSQLGAMTIPRDAYPNGFFIVFVVKGDDTECTGHMGLDDRHKSITLSITPNITHRDGVKAVVIVLTIGIGLCSFYVIGVVSHRARVKRRLREDYMSEDMPPPEHLPSPSDIEAAGPSQRSSEKDDSSLDENDIDMLDDALSDKEIIRTKRVLSVSDLAHKDPKILRHKSRLYLYYLLTIAVFYALPVVQLVATYQKVLDVTGNQDLCYFNFLCSHPFFGLSDFNHVFSNFGYLLLGLLFILLTWVREQGDLEHAEKKKSYGIPQHYGMFYAMGTALMMEGLLSACYHVCPNHTNFQFDTSFMYIISVLCMVKIYQTRHPDINARASVTFALLALIIFLGMFGVLNGSVYFWVIFTILHLLTCLLLTAQIYYMGRWRFDRGLVRRVYMRFRHDAHAGVRHVLKPMYAGRLILLIIANFCNLALAVHGNLNHNKDFATFLLSILMSNLLLYTFFYITMKICYRERILCQPLCYIILSFVTWAFALYFFINKSISWALMPAQSRHYNRPCMSFLNFFDYHDIWHFLSALAMFFSFMVLLTLDDDLEDTHRTLINVF